MKYIHTVLILFLLGAGCLQAQETDDNLLIPSVSAFTVGKGEVAVNLFGAYSYNFKAFNFNSIPYSYLESEFNSMNTFIQATIGVSANRNFNLGVDMNQVQTWEAGNTDNSSSFFRLGPRLRWRPLGELGETFDLVMQNSLLFTLGDQNDILADNPEIRNQLIASKFLRWESLGTDIILQASGELNLLTKSSLASVDQKAPMLFATSFLLGVAPNENWLAFGSINYNTESGNLPWVETDDYYQRRAGTSASAGLQFILARKHALFLSHTFLIDELRGGGANTFSVGLRLLFLKQYD